MMNEHFLNFYRELPWFRGKLRIGKLLFKHHIEQSKPVSFRAHGGVLYHLPNTIENLGIELLINGIYEEDIIRFLKSHLADGIIYFDIGANIGSLGLPVIKLKKNIQYFGFEASPEVFPYLEKNLRENGIDNYKLVNRLVHKDDQQTMKFYQSKWYGKSSLAPTYSAEYVMVNSISIDKYCCEQNIEKIDWMKIDVQGFELYVFEGMKNMLAQKKIKNILFEFESWAEEAAGFKAGTAINYIRELGYELFNTGGKLWDQNRKENDTMIWAKPKAG